MDLNLIHTFLVVADFQSYTKAANHLGLTQPAISASIKRLEEELNKKLLVKKGRGITLTATAHQLLPKFRQASNIITNAISDTSHFNVHCSEVLLHMINKIDHVTFYETPPEKYMLFDQLRLQKIDLLIDSIIMKDSAFVSEEIYSEEIVVIARRQHPRIQEGSLTKEGFYNENHCIFSGKWQELSGFEQLAKESVQERKIEQVSSSVASMVLHVAQHDSIAIISQSFAEKWKDILGLQVLPCPIPLHKIPYKLIYHKRDLYNPDHVQLRDKIKSLLSV